jgi:predicted 3-demethylubiquinone-9 3-methyltransferase (glyoxalase superfamily)
MSNHPTVRTCLWFDGSGEEAAAYYVSLLPGSVIETVSRPEPGKPAMIIELSLAGTPYMFLNGGPQYKPSPAASIVVRTADQGETDRLWSALLANGGQERPCAWLTDRFGVSWQIVPDALPRMLGADDRDAAGRAMRAMLKMKKIDIAALEAAFRGNGDSG